MRILLAEDDARLAEPLRDFLTRDQHGVTWVTDGAVALEELLLVPYDPPVLMLTARDEPRERVEALDAGADDYLSKPFSLEELLARVRARLRRATLAAGPADELRLEDLVLRPASREVSRGDKALALTAREYDLLLLLLRQAEHVITREAIFAAIWGEQVVGDDNLIDVYVRLLRRKIEQPGAPSLIQTVRGVGFMLKAGPPRD